MARTIAVEIVGDSRELEKAFARSARSAQQFNQQIGRSTFGRQADEIRKITAAEEELVRIRSRRASSIGPFRFAGVGAAAGVGLFAATQVVRELGDRLTVTGEAAFTTEGRLRNMASALTRGNLIDAFDALQRAPQTLEELGYGAAIGRDQLAALRDVAAGMPGNFRDMEGGAKAFSDEMDRQRRITDLARTADAGLAQEQLAVYDTAIVASTAMNALADSASRMGQQFITAAGALVTFKGAVDDLPGPRGPGARAFETPYRRPGMPTLGPLSPSQRRELGLIGTEGTARLPALQDRLRQLNNQMSEFHGNAEQRLKILNNIRQTEAEIAAIYADQAAKGRAAADAARAAAEAARARAEAARQARIATATGWLEFGIERAEATKAVSDDVKAWRQMERYLLERIRQEGRTLELVRDLWRARQRIRDLNKSQADRDPLAGLMQVSSKKLAGILAAGTGLGAAGRRVLGANIAGAQIQPVYVNVTLDGQPVAKSVTTQQKRSGNRTGKQTSGRRA